MLLLQLLLQIKYILEGREIGIMLSEEIHISADGLKISCTVSSQGYIKIIAYYLIDRFNKVLERKFTESVRCDFICKTNGIYKIKVFYKNIDGNDANTDAEILVNKPQLSREELLKLIEVNYRNNRLFLDLTTISEYISELVNISCSLDGSEFTESLKINGFMGVYRPTTDGNYNLTISYLDLNGERQILELCIYLTLTELIQNDYVGTNITKDTSCNYKVIISIVYAFVFREFQRKYDKGYFRYFSIILAPSVQLGVMVAIFTIMGKKTVVGLNIPLFVLTGILPYGFFTSAGNCLTIVAGNRALLNYRQVKIIDVILSSILMELLVTMLAFCGGLFVCWYLSLTIMIYNPLSLMLAFGLLFFFTFGVSMVLSVIGFYFAEFNYAIQVIFRALFYISGVFFSIENVPVQYQKYLLWNPLLQLIEFIRFSFVGFNLPHELSYLYLSKCTIVTFLIGISLYFFNRNKFMVNDRAR